jgi:heat shock protein HslJ
VVNIYNVNGDALEQTTEANVAQPAAPAPATPAATEQPAAAEQPAATPAPTTAESEELLRSAIWKWEQTQMNDGTLITASDPNRYLLEFLAGGTVAIQADCNRVLGAYTLDGTNLTIQLGPSTLVACGPDSQDQAFLKGISEIGSFLFEDGKLHLVLKLDSGTMTFSGSDATALAGTAWKVTGINNGRQAVASVIAGTTVTMAFSPDGKVVGSSGCNEFAGAYETNGDLMTVGMLVSTRKACAQPDGVMQQEANFLTALQSAATFKITGDKLEIRDAGGALQVSATQ